MKRYPSPKLVARMHFFYLTDSVKNWTKNIKTRKIANTLKTAGKIAKSSKFQSKALLLGVLQGKIINFKLHQNFFSSKLNFIFKVVKIKFGRKFGAWVSFHTATLQSWKYQDNLGRTVAVLPSPFLVNLAQGSSQRQVKLSKRKRDLAWRTMG